MDREVNICMCMCMCARMFSSVDIAGGLYQYKQKGSKSGGQPLRIYPIYSLGGLEG